MGAGRWGGECGVGRWGGAGTTRVKLSAPLTVSSSLPQTLREFLPWMLEHNSGHVVSISSMAGKAGTPMLTDYW